MRRRKRRRRRRRTPRTRLTNPLRFQKRKINVR
jgi:hypothetical protein